MNLNLNVPFRSNMGGNDFLVFLFLTASRDPECLRLFIRYWQNKQKKKPTTLISLSLAFIQFLSLKLDNHFHRH